MASKSDRFPIFVRFCRATNAALSRPAWRSHPERAVLTVSGGGEVRFFGISGFPKKSGVITVTGGSDHVHKILVPQTGVSLETLSKVWVQKIFTSRWFYRLFESFAITKTAPATCLDQQNVQFCRSGTSKKKHQNPRQARLRCTSEAHEFGGVGDENGEKRESFRDSTVQVEHLWHPSPTDILCSCVFVAQPTPHCPTQPGEATPNEPIWQFRGGGRSTLFWYFWVPEKIRGHHRHRGVRPCA